MEGIDVGRYDVAVSETVSGGWFAPRQPKPKDQLRDERYVSYMMSLDRVLSDWSDRKLNNTEALRNADYYMEKIKSIGKVDSSQTRDLLDQKGLHDHRRMDLQREYQDLKQACGQRVPQYGDVKQQRKQKSWGCC
jgi:hypothetical protein